MRRKVETPGRQKVSRVCQDGARKLGSQIGELVALQWCFSLVASYLCQLFTVVYRVVRGQVKGHTLPIPYSTRVQKAK